MSNTITRRLNNYLKTVITGHLLFSAVDCKWGPWEIGACLCETGIRTKARQKLVVEANGGTCTGEHLELEICAKADMQCPGKKVYLNDKN